MIYFNYFCLKEYDRNKGIKGAKSMRTPKPGTVDELFLSDCDFLLDMEDYDIYRKDMEHSTGIVIYRGDGNFGGYPLNQKAVDVIVHAVDELKNSNSDAIKKYWKNEIDLRINDILSDHRL